MCSSVRCRSRGMPCGDLRGRDLRAPGGGDRRGAAPPGRHRAAWRTDRMATVVYPGRGRITAPFAQVAKHYGVKVWVCPPRRPQRKGVVESAIKYITRSWWRTAPVVEPGQAQADLDRWAVAVSDRRKRDGPTIAELAAQEQLLRAARRGVPGAAEVQRVVSRTAMVAFEGNRYSVPPGLAGQTVPCAPAWASCTWSPLRPAGAGSPATGGRRPALGRSCRRAEHARLLEGAVLDAFTTASACARKQNRPPEQSGARRGAPGCAAEPGACRRPRSVRADREGRR